MLSATRSQSEKEIYQNLLTGKNVHRLFFNINKNLESLHSSMNHKIATVAIIVYLLLDSSDIKDTSQKLLDVDLKVLLPSDKFRSEFRIFPNVCVFEGIAFF